jgi:hypothetical protein
VKYGAVPNLDVASDIAFLANAGVQNAILLHARFVADYDGSVVSPEFGARADVALSADPDIANDLCIFINVRRGRD